MEEWKDIPGFEGFYSVSNFGRVRSYNSKMPNSLTGTISIRKGKGLNPWIENGYYRVGLVVKNKHSFKFVHRLEASAFLPEIQGKPFINHKDGNPLNNALDNLERCTQKENVHHAIHILKRIGTSARKVIDNNTGIIYKSIKEAHFSLKFTHSIISTQLMLNGKTKNKTTLNFYYETPEPL